MVHYALLDENNIVVQVIPGRNEDEIVDGITDWEAHYSEVTGLKCKRTSYNTLRGVHHSGGTPYRITYAGIGMIYDETLDGFIDPQPFPSWTFDADSYSWIAPISKPDAGYDWVWDEESASWKELR